MDEDDCLQEEIWWKRVWQLSGFVYEFVKFPNIWVDEDDFYIRNFPKKGLTTLRISIWIFKIPQIDEWMRMIVYIKNFLKKGLTNFRIILWVCKITQIDEWMRMTSIFCLFKASLMTAQLREILWGWPGLHWRSFCVSSMCSKLSGSSFFVENTRLRSLIDQFC